MFGLDELSGLNDGIYFDPLEQAIEAIAAHDLINKDDAE